MTVTAGSRLGPYEILAAIGAGGMGEVFRARDPRLNRDVAIKVLPAAFAKDAERLARFRREAQVLATLNHPNIAAIYGIEESGDVLGLVLELVDGEDLAARLRRGAVPPPEAITIAQLIAAGLAEAHDKGIVHRDLKPANIKLTPDGRVKILDFGLARAYAAHSGPAKAAEALSSATTQASPLTEAGIVHGTPSYMSPEQARDAVIDQRSDIWAFGCVLYEMLTGGRAFPGATSSDIIAGILTREPDWSALPAETPASLRRELARCLHKDARLRLRHIGDLRLDFNEAGTAGADRSDVSVARRTPHAALMWMLAAAAFIAGGGLSWLQLSRDSNRAAPFVSRTTITLPAGQALDVGGGSLPLAIAPDGQRLVYVADHDGIKRLYLRALDAFEPILMTGTEGASFPFFSPDGLSVGFFADGILKRVGVSGGAPIPICEAPGARPGGLGRGGTWGADGNIIFDPGDSGLMRVSANGGAPALLTSRDKAMDARNLSWPEFLPDGRGLLVTVTGLEAVGAHHLALLSFETNDWRVLGRGEQARYVSPGYLVYHAAHVREGEVQAVLFDLSRRELRGAPFSAVGGVFRSRGGGAAYWTLSQSGALVSAPGGLAHTLVRVDRSGRRTPLSDDRRGFRFPRISPDGRKVAVTIDPRPSEVWVYDIERRSRFVLARDGHSIAPAWTDDGKRIAYSNRGSRVRAADGSGVAELWREFAFPEDWTDDGALIVGDATGTNGSDIRIVTAGGDSRPLVATPANEGRARLSRDEKWLAYDSDESGRTEVYVRRFPDTDVGKWIVSTSGGHSPVWSPSGRELFYVTGATIMSVPVSGGAATFVAGTPVALFSGPFDTTQDKSFDVFPDGSGFVMVEADPDARPTRLNVVLNWTHEMRQRENPRK